MIISEPKVGGNETIDDAKARILTDLGKVSDSFIKSYLNKVAIAKAEGKGFTTGKFTTLNSAKIVRIIDKLSQSLASELGQERYRKAMEGLLTYVGVLPEKLKEVPDNKCLLSVFLTRVEFVTQNNGDDAYGLGADLVAYYLMKDKTIPRPEAVIKAKGVNANVNENELPEVTPDMVVPDDKE